MCSVRVNVSIIQKYLPAQWHKKSFLVSTNNNFPLNASKEFLDGINIEISKMAMRHERDLSYMAYTVVTYLNYDYAKPVSTVTRSFFAV